MKGPGGMWVRYSASVNVIGVLALAALCPFVPAGKLAMLSSPS